MRDNAKYLNKLNIDGRVCIVTGGGGLIGKKHTEAIVEGGGIPVLLDIVPFGMERVKSEVKVEYGDDVVIETFVTDITRREALEKVRDELL